jgi:hypothetical protein
MKVFRLHLGDVSEDVQPTQNPCGFCGRCPLDSWCSGGAGSLIPASLAVAGSSIPAVLEALTV